MCKTLEIEQNGLKLVDARCMAVRVHPEKAVSAEEEQDWQVLIESVGHKSGRLEPGTARTNGGENVEACRFSGARSAVKREEKWKNAESQGRAGRR